MSSSFGTALRVSLFGQSHAEAVGCVIEGIPAGITLDAAAIAHELSRRSGKGLPGTTPRKELDAFRIVSGLNDAGVTCAAPLCLLIENTNVRSQDYKALEHVPRPGHADYPAYLKWNGSADRRGGGHFSGRITAALVAAGALAKQVLTEHNIQIASHIAEIAGICDSPFAARDMSPQAQELLSTQIAQLKEQDGLPVLDEGAGKAMLDAVEQAHAAGDSVGGIVECVATGVPAGLGEPLFEGIEAKIAHIVFGIGGVKGLEFGAGFAAARMRGSEHNDAYRIKDGAVTLTKNNAGGNLGGLTTGAPLLMRLAIKPTSSIAREQESVDMNSLSNTTLKVQGRHDSCIALRFAPIAEAIMALALLDCILSNSSTGQSV